MLGAGAMIHDELHQLRAELARDKFEDQKARNAAAAEKLKAALVARPDGGIAPETRAKIEEALNLL